MSYLKSFSIRLWLNVTGSDTCLLLSLLHGELVFLSNDDDGSSSWKVTWLCDFFIKVVAPAWTKHMRVSLSMVRLQLKVKKKDFSAT